jgi:hypothetical protein
MKSANSCSKNYGDRPVWGYLERITGLALIVLGVACWPGGTALGVMLTYSVPVTAYLLYLGLGGQWVGMLLWPAVAVHAVLTILLAWAW